MKWRIDLCSKKGIILKWTSWKNGIRRIKSETRKNNSSKKWNYLKLKRHKGFIPRWKRWKGKWSL